MQRKYIIVDHIKTSYLQSKSFSSEKALVFLHGWQSEAAHLGSLFDGRANCIAVDLPGFGASEMHDGIWGVGDYASFLSSVLAKLGIERPILIGHSFGGSVIIKYAAHGGEARKLILIDASGVRRRSAKIFFLQLIAKIVKPALLFLSFFGISDTGMKKSFLSLVGSSDYADSGAHKDDFKRIVSEDLRGDMQKIKRETVLIWGEADKDTPARDAREMNAIIKDSSLFFIKNAGHFPFIDNAKDFLVVFGKSI